MGWGWGRGLGWDGMGWGGVMSGLFATCAPSDMGDWLTLYVPHEAKMGQ